ncbi:hypothetical protein GUJ93_ZPchr0006g43813 [Zizania palustris]|uniref:Uncharacterized protein n=1 Tax=Zizania palustris TaxID=103762 RepID=A0A8J5SRR0_ZIZPA|nr:hypothetical protein GUJ93_ZPchr0006g43813 [Zizania palustris]
MPLHAGAVQLQYFRPQLKEATADQADYSATACSASTSPAAAAMWEYHQLAHSAFQPSSSFPAYWSPYSGTTATAAPPRIGLRRRLLLVVD